MRLRPLRLMTNALILFVLGLMLAGCATSPGSSLKVDLSALTECQKLGREQPVPQISEDTDYRDLSPQALAALKKANDGARKRTKCENSVIEKYKAAK